MGRQEAEGESFRGSVGDGVERQGRGKVWQRLVGRQACGTAERVELNCKAPSKEQEGLPLYYKTNLYTFDCFPSIFGWEENRKESPDQNWSGDGTGWKIKFPFGFGLTSSWEEGEENFRGGKGLALVVPEPAEADNLRKSLLHSGLSFFSASHDFRRVYYSGPSRSQRKARDGTGLWVDGESLELCHCGWWLVDDLWSSECNWFGFQDNPPLRLELGTSGLSLPIHLSSFQISNSAIN